MSLCLRPAGVGVGASRGYLHPNNPVLILTSSRLLSKNSLQVDVLPHGRAWECSSHPLRVVPVGVYSLRSVGTATRFGATVPVIRNGVNPLQAGVVASRDLRALILFALYTSSFRMLSQRRFLAGLQAVAQLGGRAFSTVFWGF